MLIINDVLIDEDIFLQNFVCDLSSCKGRCCIEGDLGAPLEANELDLLEKYYPKVKRYLSEENRKDVEDIKEIYRKGLTFVYVKTIDDVIGYIFS